MIVASSTSNMMKRIEDSHDGTGCSDSDGSGVGDHDRKAVRHPLNEHDVIIDAKYDAGPPLRRGRDFDQWACRDQPRRKV